jgi:hypothetical protein
MPRWAVVALAGAGWSVPALNIAAVVWLKPHGPWTREIAWAFLVLVGVIVSGWMLSRMAIVVDGEGVRFAPFSSRLLWDDVANYSLVRFFGLEWIRITDRQGKIYRILLSRPEGDDLRKHLLTKLESR